MRISGLAFVVAAWVLVFFGAMAESPASQDVYAVMSGVFHDEAEQPVVDVEVSCWWFEAPLFAPPRFTKGANETRSGANGAFLLMLPFPRTSQDPMALPGPEGPIGSSDGFVVTRHPDYAITVTPWLRMDAGLYRGAAQISDIPVDLLPPRAAAPMVLTASAAATGTVRDPQGNPVVGATVTASIAIPRPVRKRVPPPGFYDPNPPPDTINVAQRLDAILNTTTAADGTFTLVGLPKGSTVALHVYHPEAGELSVGITPDSPDGQPFSFRPGEDSAEVVLPGAGSLLGQVGLPAEGSLPKDAHVRLNRMTQHSVDQRNAWVDAEGRYGVPALAPGNYQLELIAPPFCANLAMVTIEPGAAAQAPRLAAGTRFGTERPSPLKHSSNIGGCPYFWLCFRRFPSP